MDIENTEFYWELSEIKMYLEAENQKLPELKPIDGKGGMGMMFEDGGIVTVHDDTRPPWLVNFFFYSAELPSRYIYRNSRGTTRIVNEGLVENLRSDFPECGVIFLCNEDETHRRCVRPREGNTVTIINIYEPNHVCKLYDE